MAGIPEYEKSSLNDMSGKYAKLVPAHLVGLRKKITCEHNTIHYIYNYILTFDSIASKKEYEIISCPKVSSKFHLKIRDPGKCLLSS